MSFPDQPSLSPRPRFEDLDRAWATEVADFCAQERGRLVGWRAETGTQVEYGLLAMVCTDLALVRYAMGDGLSDVRLLMKEAAEACGVMFELRGTQPAIPMSSLDQSAAQPDRFGPNAQEGSRGARVGIDYSLTRPPAALRALHLAAISGDTGTLAAVLDAYPEPPEGRDAEDLLLSTILAVHREVSSPDLGQHGVGARRDDETEAYYLVLEGLLRGDGPAVAERMHQLVQVHEREASHPNNRHQPDRFICLPALGLSALALTRHVVTREDLPGQSLYLPLEILEIL